MSSRASFYGDGSRAAPHCASHSVVRLVRQWILWAFFLASVSPAYAGGGEDSDTQPPTVPTSLTATPASGVAITLGWGASTDDVGVTGYLVELCLGAGCTAFSQVTSTPTSPFTVSGLAALTTYSFRIRASDAAGNLSGYSNTVSAATGVNGSICD
jgi:fibronectin type III domain protein